MKSQISGVCKKQNIFQALDQLAWLQWLGPGWRGAEQILSTVPTVDWVLLGPGESIKGKILAAFPAACLQTHLAFGSKSV